jgi:hypothetical protein
MKEVQHLMESELAGATKVFGETLPQCQSVHHKSRMKWYEVNVRGEKPLTNRLGYGIA